MVETSTSKAAPAAHEPSPDTVEATVCTAVLQSVDAETRAAWLRLCNLPAFDAAVALALLDKDHGSGRTLLRRLRDLPIVAPAGRETWSVRRGARLHCAQTLKAEAGEAEYAAFHQQAAQAVLDWIERDALLAPDGWRRQQRELQLAYHLLPADPEAGLAMLFRVERAAAAGGRPGAIVALYEALEPHRPYLPKDRPESAYLSGLRQWREGNPASARGPLAAALAVCDQDESELTAAVLYALGCVLAALEDVAGASAALERSRALHERLALPRGAACCSIALGKVLDQCGQHEAALERLREGQEASRALRDHRLETTALAALAGHFRQLKRNDQAERAYRQSKKLCHGVGDSPGELASTVALAELQQAAGQPGPATTAFLAALDLAEADSNDRLLSGCLQNLGLIYRQQRRYELFLAVGEKQLRVEKQRRNKYGEFFAACHTGDALFELGDYHAAVESYKRGLDLSDREGNVTKHCRQRLKEAQERQASQNKTRGPRLKDLLGCAGAAAVERPALDEALTKAISQARRLLASAATVALDAGVLQDLLRGEGPGMEALRPLFGGGKRIRLFTSAGDVGVLVGWLRRNNLANECEKLERLFTESLQIVVVPIDTDVAARAARVREAHPDLTQEAAYSLVVAQLGRVDLFLTGAPALARISRVAALALHP